MYGKNYKVISTECQGVVPTGTEYPCEQGVYGGIRTATTTRTINGGENWTRPEQQRCGSFNGDECGVRGVWEQEEIVGEMCKMPRILPFYGKSRQELEQIMQHVEQNPSDLAIHCLLNAHSTYTPKVYPFRGFTLVNGEQRVRQIEQVEQLEQRPVWYLFSGMGIEQWQCGGMLKEMMKLDSFRRSIVRSCDILRPYGVNLMQLINGQQEPTMRLNGVESFVYLTCVQIALVDCLRQIGVRPEGLIGQSIGELVCAYVDQCLTHEQALMTSYYLAKCLQQAKHLPKSLMAVVGDLTWEQLKSKCPSGVVPVCFDSLDQFMITGPMQQVKEFLRQLRFEGIYVREIELPCNSSCQVESNFGLIHSQYLNEIVPTLRQYLECLNIVPKQRSSRWISTSQPEHKWSTQMNVEYLLNLFTSPVMLQQTLRRVPSNAIIVEISPKCLLQTLLKKHFSQTTTNVFGDRRINTNGNYVLPTIISLMPNTTRITTTPTTTSNTFGIECVPSHLEHFLVQLGRLYVEGVDFDSVKLFVPVHLEKTIYPVPVEQNVLGLLSNKWNIKPEPLSFYVPKQPSQLRFTSDDSILSGLNGLKISSNDVETFKFTVDVESLLEKESYLLNHQINGRVLYPTSGYLYLVWKSLAQLRKQQEKQQSRSALIDLDSVFGQPCEIEQLPPVCFENVQIHRATVLREQPQQVVIVPQRDRRVLFQINIQPTTGLFEIVEGKNVIVNGRVYVPTGCELSGEFVTPFKSQWESQVRCNLAMPQEEIYKRFRQYGYEYNGEFQPIVRSNVSGTQGELLWTGKWIPFLDAMLQMNVLAQKCESQTTTTTTSNGLLLPTRIRSIKVNPIEHLTRADRFVTLPVFHDLYTNKTVCGSIEINGLQVTPVVLPRGQFYPTIAGCIESAINYGGFNKSTGPFNGIQRRCFLNVEGEQIPFVGQWCKKQQQQEKQEQFTIGNCVEQTTTSLTTKVGQWTVEQQQQPSTGVFGGKWTTQPQTTTTFNPRLTHVIVGALDCEFGLELAQWMVQCGGVRYLILTTTQRVNSSLFNESTLNIEQVEKLRYLQNEYGCQIKIVTSLDLSDETECLLLVKQACRMTSHLEGRIGSIFHLGGLFVEQTNNTSVSIKSLYHLDKYTRCQTVMPDYGYFVVFTRSELNGLTQTGLKTIIDGVCESRRRECGKHALVVDWTFLFNGEQTFSEIQYSQAMIRLEQMLVKSVRYQLPIEFQQQQQYESSFGESCFGGDYQCRKYFDDEMNKYCVTPCEYVYDGAEQVEQYVLRPTKMTDGRKSCDFEMIYTPRQSQQQGQVYLMPQRIVEKLNNIEYNVYGQQQQPIEPLFVVLPIDEKVNMIKSWAKQLKVPVYGLNYTQECLKYETVEQLSQFYWQQIEKLFPKIERVHLVGHTYGVPVAFEMASRRPQQVQSLALLDSEMTQSFLNGSYPRFESITGVECDALYKFYQQCVTPSSSVRVSCEQFSQVLSQLTTFDERVKYVVGKIVEQCQYGYDLVDLEQCVRSFVQKMTMSCRYVPTQPLRLNKILVVRPTTGLTSGKYQSQQFDYVFGKQQQDLYEQELIEKILQGLNKFVFGKLQIHLIDADQKSFLQGENGSRIASILNQYLVREF